MTLGTTLPGKARTLLNALASSPESEWLEQGRMLTLEGDIACALAVFNAATLRFPASSDALLGLAGLLWQSGQSARAEQLLQDWLYARPEDAGAAFLLASLLREQGRLKGVGKTLMSLFSHGPHQIDTVIRAVEMLDDYGCASDAFAICEAAIDGGADDPRLHAYAGMLGIQLGLFERTRSHYLRALAQTPEALNWNIPLGLAGLQRYATADHTDFALFHDALKREGLPEPTRRALLFALGKAYDDLGDFATAATYLRQANSSAHAASHWSRKHWKRSIEARLAAPPNPVTLPAQDWTPVFIVGVPRSGTTLLAQQLARHSGVKNRGELGWLELWERRLSSAPPTRHQLEQAAAECGRHLRQDDDKAHWYIDKQPLNLLRIDLAMAMWPNARIIHCERDPRDTALSLWSQSFHDPAHDYAYDFSDIATVIRDCRRLANHWSARYPASFMSVPYEKFVGAPEETLRAISQWLGLSGRPEPATLAKPNSIATASAWQARQPVHTNSAGRWQNYLPYVPELATLNVY